MDIEQLEKIITENLNPDPWLNLGIGGAALFIILIVIILLFRMQNKSIMHLCNKLDALTSAFTENNLELSKVIISNDKDQKEMLRFLGTFMSILQDLHRRVVRIDTRLYDEKQNKQNNEKGEETQ